MPTPTSLGAHATYSQRLEAATDPVIRTTIELVLDELRAELHRRNCAVLVAREHHHAITAS